ncbi:hypothetical protein [Gracilimonas sp.]|uniref:hypothetical protein n=1 Tax=Gracilimonas sp. TaxID=1974203 RepID=UPI003BADA891
METIKIQIKDRKALKILKELEDLDILKVLSADDAGLVSKEKLSDKYAGALSSDTAQKMHNYVNESREEWDDRDI